METPTFFQCYHTYKKKEQDICRLVTRGFRQIVTNDNNWQVCNSPYKVKNPLNRGFIVQYSLIILQKH